MNYIEIFGLYVLGFFCFQMILLGYRKFRELKLKDEVLNGKSEVDAHKEQKDLHKSYSFSVITLYALSSWLGVALFLVFCIVFTCIKFIVSCLVACTEFIGSLFKVDKTIPYREDDYDGND